MAYEKFRKYEDGVVNEHYLGWKQDPMTIEVFKHLEKRITEIEGVLGSGGAINRSSAVETLANSCWEAGKIEGIREIFDLVIE